MQKAELTFAFFELIHILLINIWLLFFSFQEFQYKIQIKNANIFYLTKFAITIFLIIRKI